MSISLIVIVSTLMLSISRIILAYISQSMSFLTETAKWIKSHEIILKLCDELLAIASFLFSSYIIFFVLSYKQGNHFSLAIIIASLLYCIFAWIGIILTIGNMVYPVNGIKPLEKHGLSTTILQIYSRLHLSDLSLGIMTISLSSLIPNLSLTFSGVIIGSMQMMFTYYSKKLNYKMHIFTIVIWNIWIILFQIL